MATKLNMKNLGKLEKDGVYIVQFSRPLRMEETQAMVEQFKLTTQNTGSQFILFNNEMKILNPIDCKDVLIEVLREWERNRLRIVP